MRDQFDKHLRSACNEVQKEKFRVMKRSRIFKGWSTDAIIRLARLARFKVIPRKAKPVAQGENCELLYFIQKGICKVLKYPDRVAQLERDQINLRRALDKSRLKYSYHRTLHKFKKAEKEKAGLDRKKKKDTRFYGVTAKAQELIDDGKGVFMGSDHITEGELAQEEIERKIAENARLVVKYRREDKGVVRTEKEIETLVAPAFFGFESILEPKKSLAMGTVVANTAVHCVVVHQKIFQAFSIDHVFLKNIKDRSTVFPDDLTLTQDLDNTRDWDGYKAEQMESINKSKWPLQKAKGYIVKDMPGGRSVVVRSAARESGDVQM